MTREGKEKFGFKITLLTDHEFEGDFYADDEKQAVSLIRKIMFNADAMVAEIFKDGEKIYIFQKVITEADVRVRDEEIESRTEEAEPETVGKVEVIKDKE